MPRQLRTVPGAATADSGSTSQVLGILGAHSPVTENAQPHSLGSLGPVSANLLLNSGSFNLPSGKELNQRAIILSDF